MEAGVAVGKQITDAGAAVWRLLVDEAAGAAWNMAADEALLLSHAAGETPPTLRFYAWNPSAVSLGYFQRADEEIDRAACARHGIDVVRRLTGGRAVLHEMEVTYSLVVRENAPYIPSGVTASYLYFSRGITAGLTGLGVGSQMQEPGPAGRSSGKLSHSAACFDAPSHYEITVGGRKVVGSAQVRKNGVLLQHGSILLQFCPERMTSVMRFEDDAARMEMASELSRRATDLSEASGRPVGFDEVVNAVHLGMENQCGLKFIPGMWTGAELEKTREFANHKYCTDEWNLRR